MGELANETHVNMGCGLLDLIIDCHTIRSGAANCDNLA